MVRVYKNDVVKWLKSVGLKTEKIERDLEKEDEIIEHEKALEYINKYYTADTARMFIAVLSVSM